MQAETCTAQWICRNCAPSGGCSAVTNPPMYKVSSHGQVNGTVNMQNEIYARGPIACTIAVTSAFESYSGGIFSDSTGARGANQVVEIVGWGPGYWIGRNSWGTYWGEHGWFQMAMGVDTLGVESQGCVWAVPDPASFPVTPFN